MSRKDTQKIQQVFFMFSKLRQMMFRNSFEFISQIKEINPRATKVEKQDDLESSYFLQSPQGQSFIIRKLQNMNANIASQTLLRFKDEQMVCEIACECRKDINFTYFKSIRLRVSDILQKFYLLEQKYNISKSETNKAQWKQEQKKIFLCFLVAFCRLYAKKIGEITESQWSQISVSFHGKDVLVLKYQARVIERNGERVHWSPVQEELLSSCLKGQMNGRWADISRLLFKESKGEHFKTPKQCRQHWFNHMNITVRRGGWEVKQDLIILQSVLDYGHKWARVSDILQGHRTEHMIKNRFHSLLTCASKIAGQKHDQKNQPKLVKILINQLSSKQFVTENKKKLQNFTLSQQSIQDNKELLQQDEQVEIEISLINENILLKPDQSEESLSEKEEGGQCQQLEEKKLVKIQESTNELKTFQTVPYFMSFANNAYNLSFVSSDYMQRNYNEMIANVLFPITLCPGNIFFI